MALRDLRGLGPSSEAWLKQVGVDSEQLLIEVGAIEAFMRLRRAEIPGMSLNFLYALVGAIEDKHWLEVSRTDKAKLLMALQAYEALENIVAQSMAEEGVEQKTDDATPV